MITEDHVSFETAKLLKEKGFGGECVSMYVTPKPHAGMGNPNEAKIAPHGRDSHYYDGYHYQCEAPTLQMAMKWLRKVHNIHIEVRITDHSFSSLIAIPRYYWIIFNAKEVKWMDESTAHESMSYETVEEACEAAIKSCLENLI